VDPGVVVTDVDSPTLAGATIQLRDFTPSQATLSITTPDGITSSWDPATGTLALNGTAPVAAYQQALASLIYQQPGAAPSSGPLQVVMTVTDGHFASAPAIVEIAFPEPTVPQLPPALPVPASSSPDNSTALPDIQIVPSEQSESGSKSSSQASRSRAGSSSSVSTASGGAATPPAQAPNPAPAAPAAPAAPQQPQPQAPANVAAPVAPPPLPLPIAPAAPVAAAPPPAPAPISPSAELSFIAQGGQLDQDLKGFQASVERQVAANEHVEATVAETVGVVGGGLAIGYVIWIIRGGYLLSSLLFSMPAWRLIDPLPILDYLDDEGRADKKREDEDQSLEELLRKKPPSAPV
jgi:hypothetical protein